LTRWLTRVTIAGMKTDRQQLVEAKLGRPVVDWIQERRDAGRSWVKVSYDLAAAIGVEVSFETLRRWYEEQAEAAKAQP